MELPKPEEINSPTKRTIKYLNNHFPGFIEFLNIKYPFAETVNEKIYNYLNRPDATSRPLCKICGEPVNYFPTRGYTIYCGVKCSANSPEKQQKFKCTTLSHYGVENPSQSKEITSKRKTTLFMRYGDSGYNNVEKTKKTNLERYGVENVSKVKEFVEKSKQAKYNFTDEKKQSIQDKYKKTCFERYGMEHYTNIEQRSNTMIDKYGISQFNNIEKRKKTCLEKYGVEHYIHCAQYKTSNLKKYGAEYPLQAPEVLEKIRNTNMEKYGVTYACMRPEAKISSNNSVPNKNFAKLLSSYNIEYTREYSIDHYSYDFKVGNNLIEIDPTPTHNSTWGAFGSEPKTNKYHLDKSKTANESGFNCIHIWDWDDPLKIVQLITPKETIYARKCSIKEITVKEANEFLNQHHLQGRCNGQRVCISLIYNNECVGLMTFGKPRYNKKFQWELLRLCFNKNVIGGSERLFKYFISHYNPESIISYCDRSKFSGTVYKRLGFTLKSTSGPSKHWYNIKTKQHITDNLLRQRGYDQLFNADYGKGTSNEQLMLEHGFVEVYDCGQDSYAWK